MTVLHNNSTVDSGYKSDVGAKNSWKWIYSEDPSTSRSGNVIRKCV